MTATAANALHLSASQVGVAESPAGSNRVKYSEWYGVIGPWCAMFQSWVLYSLGMRFTGAQSAKGWASAELMHQWFIAHHRMVTTPAPGDIVFYHVPGEHAGANHVGMFLSHPAAGKVKSRDGNTSGTNPRDGGMVADMVRDTSWVLGYGRPPWTAQAATTAPTAPPTWWTRTQTLTSPYMHGPDVLAAQKRLQAHGFYAGFSLDGIFGPAMDQGVHGFQTHVGITSDGDIGPTTAHYLGG